MLTLSLSVLCLTNTYNQTNLRQRESTSPNKIFSDLLVLNLLIKQLYFDILFQVSCNEVSASDLKLTFQFNGQHNSEMKSTFYALELDIWIYSDHDNQEFKIFFTIMNLDSVVIKYKLWTNKTIVFKENRNFIYYHRLLQIRIGTHSSTCNLQLQWNSVIMNSVITSTLLYDIDFEVKWVILVHKLSG
jgi:hypothetical protein